jgi:hypothetical protein
MRDSGPLPIHPQLRFTCVGNAEDDVMILVAGVGLDEMAQD